MECLRWTRGRGPQAWGRQGQAGPKLRPSPGRWAQPRELESLSPGGPSVSCARSWFLQLLVMDHTDRSPRATGVRHSPGGDPGCVRGSSWLPGWPCTPAHSLWTPARAGEEWAWRCESVRVCESERREAHVSPSCHMGRTSVGKVGHSGGLLLRWSPAPVQSSCRQMVPCTQHCHLSGCDTLPMSLHPSHRSAGATSQISSHAEHLPCLSYGQSTLLFQLLICFHCRTNFRAVTLISSWLAGLLQHLICSSRTGACPGACFGRSVRSLLILHLLLQGSKWLSFLDCKFIKTAVKV